MKENIETKTARTVLQQPERITVAGTLYEVAPPSTATLILASEVVARMPQFTPDPQRIVEQALALAGDCRPLGELVALLILGAKGLTQTRKVKREVEKSVCDTCFFGLVRRPRTVVQTVEEEVVVDRLAELSRVLLEELTPAELHSLTARLLARMQVADFFGLTTFLSGINLLRQTRGVGTTASGQ